ncbi:hypothetical protein GCM10023335_17290 [Streptomyces siamensis]|uniref:Uncharacterized protein n=1 Tax=Streptomyces siamensis TaxID=1274986 RepID=A0ABP9IMY7_9ACTN
MGLAAPAERLRREPGGVLSVRTGSSASRAGAAAEGGPVRPRPLSARAVDGSGRRTAVAFAAGTAVAFAAGTAVAFAAGDGGGVGGCVAVRPSGGSVPAAVGAPGARLRHGGSDAPRTGGGDALRPAVRSGLRAVVIPVTSVTLLPRK